MPGFALISTIFSLCGPFYNIDVWINWSIKLWLTATILIITGELSSIVLHILNLFGSYWWVG